MAPAHLPPAPAFAALRLSLFYVAFFLVVGVLMPFWPLWLEAKGLDAAEIGVVLALGPWVRVVGNPLIAHLADRRGETRRPLILLALASLASFSLFAFAEGFWTLFGVAALSGLWLSAIMPLGDGLTLRLALARRLDYGRVRLCGSLAFVVAASLGGWALAGRPPDRILDLLLVGLALTAAAALALPEWRRPAAAPLAVGVLGLLADRRMILFLAAASLIQGSHSVLYGFGTLHWQAAGHSKDVVGWLWAEAVIAEVLLFAAGAAALRRLGAARLLALAGIAGLTRWTLAGLSTDLPVLAAVQLLHGLTFGAAHLAAMDFLARAVPPGLAVTAQGLYAATATGAAFGATMLLAGTLYAAFAGGAFFAMAALALVGAAIAASLARRRPPTEGDSDDRQAA
ncbi:MAG TPA: 3-phenylpropionate MFS transporter [Dongiaceae bacterium]|nr:3-phenylpropionate MFS transporter [Dongiaceae bacterium]